MNNSSPHMFCSTHGTSEYHTCSPASGLDSLTALISTSSNRPLDESNNGEPNSLPRRVRASAGSDAARLSPETATIGSITIGPFELVSLPEIHAHLVFLGAFARLKARVKSQSGPDIQHSADELWAIYIARAVDRFALWVNREISNWREAKPRQLTEEEVPPFDVLMAWHTYMLNPRVYYEDGLRGKSQLLKISAFPFDLVDKILDTDRLIALRPSVERQQRFESHIGQTWDVPLGITFSDTTFVPCPRCPKKSYTEVCWVTEDNTGFAQHNFKARCHTCFQSFDRSAMMVRSLCDDIIKVRTGLEKKSNKKAFLAGTVLNGVTGVPNPQRALRGNFLLLKNFRTGSLAKLTSGDKLANALKYSPKRLETNLKVNLDKNVTNQEVRIMSYYRSSNYPFSIELCGAILRQGSFIDKMVNLGWTEPHTFDDDSTTLIRCIARYNAWLTVMKRMPGKMLVPTLDIDLAWHTHQLKQTAYRIQTLKLLGRYVNHDDKIEEGKLSDAYEKTAKYWEQCWGVPYSVCGCIQPPHRRSHDPAATISKIFRGKAKAPPEFNNPQPRLASIQEHDAPLTHPSEHNSILVVGKPLSAHHRATRNTTYTKWEGKMRSDLEKGELPVDGWEAMNTRRAEGHQQGFMRPMPDSNLTPVIPYGAETCAAYDGGVLHRLSPGAYRESEYSAGVCAPGAGYYSMPIEGFQTYNAERNERIRKINEEMLKLITEQIDLDLSCASGTCGGGGGGGCGGGGGGCGGGGGGGGGGAVANLAVVKGRMSLDPDVTGKLIEDC